MSPSITPNTTTTSTGTIIMPSPALAANPSAFSKILSVLVALEPLALAAAAPFIKNSTTEALVVDEAPVAQALLEALKAL